MFSKEGTVIIKGGLIMKGYVAIDKDKAEVRYNLPEPKCGPSDAVIKPVIVAPCTTDLHLLKTLPWPYTKGKSLGHEVAGVIHEIGSEVKDFKKGDRVILGAGMPNWKNYLIQDGYDKFDLIDPNLVEDPNVQGAFAEYKWVPDAEMNLAKLPDSVSWEQAVMLTDMGSTAFEGVAHLDLKCGETVVVLGIGPVGLMTVSAVVQNGAGRVIGIGSRQVCFDVAKEFGVTDLINYRDGDVVKQVLDLNGGPVDRVVVCGGASSKSIGDALAMIRFGGTVVNVAAFFDDEKVVIPNEVWAYGCMDKTIRTVLSRGGRAFMERLIAMVQYGRIHPEKLITHTFHGFEEIEKALRMMGGEDRNCIKSVIYL